MGTKTPKTLEEFAINEIQDLREENESLKQELEMYKKIEETQNENIKFWINKYYELVNKLKEDFDIKIKKLYDECYYFEFNHIYSNSYEEKYKYYKNLFNLKEEGENNNE